MPEYDFAILNMLNHNRRGLAARKYFLDRLAPILFAPRVENLIDFSDLGFRGCHVFLPLGPENWNQMEADQRGSLWKKSENIMQDFAVASLAADRRLKAALQPCAPTFPLLFGDDFIQALAVVLIRHLLSKRPINKLVIVGEMGELLPLLDCLEGCGIPVSVQNQQPAHDEVIAWRFLYEKGRAVSSSYVCPDKWDRGDLIVMFQPGYKRLAMASPGIFWLELSDEGQNLAPSLENALVRVGMDSRLPILAPILESILYAKAGISARDVEINGLNLKREIKNGRELEVLIEAGEQLGLWDPFREGCTAIS